MLKSEDKLYVKMFQNCIIQVSMTATFNELKKKFFKDRKGLIYIFLSTDHQIIECSDLVANHKTFEYFVFKNLLEEFKPKYYRCAYCKRYFKKNCLGFNHSAECEKRLFENLEKYTMKFQGYVSTTPILEEYLIDEGIKTNDASGEGAPINTGTQVEEEVTTQKLLHIPQIPLREESDFEKKEASPLDKKYTIENIRTQDTDSFIGNKTSRDNLSKTLLSVSMKISDKINTFLNIK